MSELIEDEPAAARRRELGLARAGQFSWAAAARGTLASYSAALGG
jgi:hypothetical protein